MVVSQPRMVRADICPASSEKAFLLDETMSGLGGGGGYGMVARLDAVSVAVLFSRLGLSCLIVYYSLVL